MVIVLFTFFLQMGHILPFNGNMVSVHGLQNAWPHGLHVRVILLSWHIGHTNAALLLD